LGRGTLFFVILVLDTRTAIAIDGAIMIELTLLRAVSGPPIKLEDDGRGASEPSAILLGTGHATAWTFVSLGPLWC
jgi:hypothetical protein